MNAMLAEVQRIAPTFYTVISAATGCESEGPMATAISILLKQRNERVSALAYVISILLYHSGIKKRTAAVLNRLGICAHPSSLRRKLRDISKYFDLPVVQSKMELSGTVDIRAPPAPSNDTSSSSHSDDDSDIEECDSGDDDESFYISHQDGDKRLMYQITGNNLDLSIKTKFMTQAKRNKSYHWFNMVATNERFPVPSTLSSGKPRCSILDIDNKTFVASLTDLDVIKESFTTLIAKTLTKYVSELHDYRSFVCDHIVHEYSDIAAQKSIQISLGLIEHNEQKTDEMIEIAKNVNSKYVPYVAGSVARPMQFGGDQLTTERLRSSCLALSDGDSEEKRLTGLLPHSEDFHCHMNFIDLIFSKFYLDKSKNECGTLAQLKCLLNRKNVSKTVTDTRSSTTFINDILDGYVVAAFMFLNEMKSPQDNVVPPGIPETLKKTWFYERVSNVVETFVIRPLTSAIEKLRDGDGKDEISKSKKQGEDHTYCSSIESFHCRWYGCGGTFTSYEKRTAREDWTRNDPP